MKNIFYFTDIVLFQKYAVLEKMQAGDSIQLEQGLFIVDEGFVSYGHVVKDRTERFYGVKDTILHIPTNYMAETDCVLWYLPEIFIEIARQSEEISHLLAYAVMRENQWLTYLQQSNIKKMDAHFINLLKFEDIYRRDYNGSVKNGV
ncbi:hypothetical protein HB848_06960 [Listeria rocourtiae]|uniref:hypothetical protein n=1 Tax=Listeria rocourtiae TaxID=647910 RepID=UPI001628A097|nr:hypothetical protein [Listeria rocourtiae]MBC1435077.1 hypothetical protein [Listeria rocourtiae]